MAMTTTMATKNASMTMIEGGDTTGKGRGEGGMMGSDDNRTGGGQQGGDEGCECEINNQRPIESTLMTTARCDGKSDR
jgi:hypothetical protein